MGLSITFTRIAELFITELRSGGAPRIEEYLRAFPHLHKEIQGRFPTLQLMESLPKAPCQPLRSGDIVAGCVVDCEIGRGGMGVVYLAKDNLNHRKVAIKVLPRDRNDRADLSRFQREHKAMSRLSHANILPIYSHGSTEDVAYLVIKYIDGCNLAQLLKGLGNEQARSKLSVWRSDWRCFASDTTQLVAGLVHAHRKGLVHRDIKPSNLLLDGDGKIWISDFGLAKVWGNGSSISNTGVVGTPRFMAPEQIRGVCDARSDIYSLGVTLYEIASGEHAIKGNCIEDFINNRSNCLQDIRELTPSMPPALAEIIMRACRFQPQDRFQSAREMHVALKRFCRSINSKFSRLIHGLLDYVF